MAATYGSLERLNVNSVNYRELRREVCWTAGVVSYCFKCRLRKRHGLASPTQQQHRKDRLDGASTKTKVKRREVRVGRIDEYASEAAERIDPIGMVHRDKSTVNSDARPAMVG